MSFNMSILRICQKNSKKLSFDYIFIEPKTIRFEYFSKQFQRRFFQTFETRIFSKLLVSIFHLSKTLSRSFQNFSTNLHSFFHDRPDLKIKPNSFFLEFLNRSWASLTVLVPNSFYVHTYFLVHIQFFYVHTNLYLYIIQIPL